MIKVRSPAFPWVRKDWKSLGHRDGGQAWSGILWVVPIDLCCNTFIETIAALILRAGCSSVPDSITKRKSPLSPATEIDTKDV